MCMKKGIKITLLGIMVIMLGNVAVTAQESLLIVREDKNYPPNEMIEQGELTGFHIELIQTVAKQLGLSVTFKSMPWGTALGMMMRGEADAITYIKKTSSMEKTGAYFFDGNILSENRTGLLVLETRQQDIQYTGDIQTIVPYRIGIQRGGSYGKAFAKEDNLNILEVDSKDQLNEMIKTGSVDVIIMNYDEFIAAQEQGFFQEVIYLEPDIVKDIFYIAFSKPRKLEAIAKQFADAMIAFKQTDQYQKIRAKYRIKNIAPMPKRLPGGLLPLDSTGTSG